MIPTYYGKTLGLIHQQMCRNVLTLHIKQVQTRYHRWIHDTCKTTSFVPTNLRLQFMNIKNVTFNMHIIIPLIIEEAFNLRFNILRIFRGKMCQFRGYLIHLVSSKFLLLNSFKGFFLLMKVVEICHALA